MLELVVAICIVALLAAMAADRLFGIRTSAERAGVEATIGNIRSAIGIRVAALAAKGNIAGIVALAQANPMELLSEPPESYRGAFFGVDPALFSAGDWYFDGRDRTLVYLIKYDDQLAAGPVQSPKARFAVRLVYDDTNGNKVFDPGLDHATGVQLTAIEGYQRPMR